MATKGNPSVGIEAARRRALIPTKKVFAQVPPAPSKKKELLTERGKIALNKAQAWRELKD